METQAEAPATASETPPTSAPESFYDDEPRAGQPEKAPGADPDAATASPLVVRAVPGAAMAVESMAAAGAGLWHAGGWAGVALGAAAAGGAGAALVRRRRSGRWRSRSGSTPRPRSGGSSGRPRTGSSTGRRSSTRMPSLGAGRSGSRRSGSGMPGAGRRAGGAGSPRRGAAAAGRGRAAAFRSTPARRGTAALRSTGRGTGRALKATRRAGGQALDRAAGTAARNRKAARAAHRAMREGGSSRGAARAARKALRKSHKKDGTQGRRWRRMAGAGAWGAAGWLYGTAFTWNKAMNGGAAAAVERIRAHFAGRRPGAAEVVRPARRRIDTKVDRPAARAAAGGGYGGRAMSRASFVETAWQLADDFRRYQPPDGDEGMYEFYQHVAQLPEVLREVANGMRVFEQNAGEDWPLHPAIVEFIGAMRQAQQHLAQAAEEIRPAIQRHHAPELERIEAPRPGEHMWNKARH
ncbi:hypothetical protein [Actinomadura sp. 21ATH]|uniref:hypothetical protein n=1 Tax=Actinomadura sp. 21ATH TaxID=1735444 RepID=UPI0035C22E58